MSKARSMSWASVKSMYGVSMRGSIAGECPGVREPAVSTTMSCETRRARSAAAARSSRWRSCPSPPPLPVPPRWTGQMMRVRPRARASRQAQRRSVVARTLATVPSGSAPARPSARSNWRSDQPAKAQSSTWLSTAARRRFKQGRSSAGIQEVRPDAAGEAPASTRFGRTTPSDQQARRPPREPSLMMRVWPCAGGVEIRFTLGGIGDTAPAGARNAHRDVETHTPAACAGVCGH